MVKNLKKTLKILLILQFMLLLIFTGSRGFSFQEKFTFFNKKSNSGAKLNFVDYTITATGTAKIPAIEQLSNKKPNESSAVIDIFQARKLAIDRSIFNAKNIIWSKLEKTPLDSENSIQTFMAKKRRARISLGRMLQKIKLINQTVESDKIISTIRLSLIKRGFGKNFSSKQYLGNIFNIFLYSENNEELRDLSKRIDFPRFSAEISPTPYSGLIVDLRGHKTQPCLLPKIYDESGLVIYDFTRVRNNIINRIGLVKYSKQFNLAQLSNRIGTNPYYIAALTVVGEKYKSDPVILRKHTLEILGHDQTRQALKNAKVVFLID